MLPVVAPCCGSSAPERADEAVPSGAASPPHRRTHVSRRQRNQRRDAGSVRQLFGENMLMYLPNGGRFTSLSKQVYVVGVVQRLRLKLPISTLKLCAVSLLSR